MRYSNHIEHYKIDNQYYDYFSVDRFVEQENRRRYEAIFHLLKPTTRDHVLDIGSGGGPILTVIHREKMHYFPLDISDFNLRKIREKAGTTIYPTAGDGYQLPFMRDSFDHVILSEVLEHLDDPETVLKEVYRILRPKGSIIISVPYKEKIDYQICIHCNKPTPTHAHLQSFDEMKLNKLVCQEGFIPQKSMKILNKIPNRLHINILLKKIPFLWWRIIDSSFNWFIDKPISLILMSKKIS